MVRTQIYVTERQHKQLAAIARTARKKQSQLIREAIDHLLERLGHGRRELVLRGAAGIWRDRTDLPDFKAVREGWDRC